MIFFKSRCVSVSSNIKNGESRISFTAKNKARFASVSSPDDNDSVPNENFLVGGVAVYIIPPLNGTFSFSKINEADDF